MATVVSGGAAGSLASAEITKDAMRRAKRDDVPSPWWATRLGGVCRVSLAGGEV